MDWEKIKLGSWGAVGGALVTMYIGFNVGGWMTNGTENVGNYGHSRFHSGSLGFRQ